MLWSLLKPFKISLSEFSGATSGFKAATDNLLEEKIGKFSRSLQSLSPKIALSQHLIKLICRNSTIHHNQFFTEGAFTSVPEISPLSTTSKDAQSEKANCSTQNFQHQALLIQHHPSEHPLTRKITHVHKQQHGNMALHNKQKTN